MSRFGLRSASDILKQPEENLNRRKTCNPVSISMKRNSLQKDAKYLTTINDENVIDDIKIEIEDVERISDIGDGPLRNKNIKSGDNDDDDEDADAECLAQPLPFKGSLVCSLPLDRITDVIQKLNLKSSIDTVVAPKQYLEKECDEVDESVDNDDDEEDDNNISKQSTSAIKNLCLYCDKKFSSHKMQLKHVEKFHCLQQDRRCSGRNSQIQQSQVPRKRKSTIGSQNFPGCNFCQKNKSLTQSIILPAADLSALFVHLADCHTDKYFGCKACVLRFQNVSKLSKHMEIVHKSLPYVFDESSCKSRDNDTDSMISNDKSSIGERSKLSLKRQQRSQKNSSSGSSNNGSGFVSNTITAQCSAAITQNTSVIGAEEPILSRLGLTQNRLPNNRKGVRLRREKMLPEVLLKSEQNHTSSSSFVSAVPSSSILSSTCSPKLRGKTVKVISNFSGDPLPDVIFRVPTRNDILSCVFDDNFYKEVVPNVRNNLIFHMDGKIMGTSQQTLDESVMAHTPQPQIRSTLVKSPIVVTTMESEIHAATSLAAVTAFPTLLTAAQFGGDGASSKLRRPHTKNSWKWKWDSVKKFKLVNEGGKIVKKMKHPMLGLRDLSKLDMWTQLTMRQKHELLQQQQCNYSEDTTWPLPITEIPNDPSREEKQRLNDQLNMILDMRLLPHIILEQNEQAIIKLENDEFGITPFLTVPEDSGDNLMTQTFADESFLSMLNLLPNINSHNRRAKLVLSGEWARPRCYLCMCCGAKFEKLKSLEEHKMFRHSQILSTHYEVVGRELLNGNLLRHLFLPKKALSRYANEMGSQLIYSGAARRLFWHKNEALAREITNNDESSDSLQSLINSCTTNSPSIKNSSSTEDCDIETKIVTTTALDLIANNTVVSPTHSIQSCSSSSSTGLKSPNKMQNNSQPLAINVSSTVGNGSGCSKCGRKCNGILELYRHMLDCSGDYVWSLAKKRKYRYYCGSKKRRPCNKHSILELRKTKPKPQIKTPTNTNESTEEGGASTSGNFAKTKTSPRPRPSDAESIKKMLENLPAKRVCKKIFPALSKAKKNIKNIKPKLLSKHKIYNSLRKTRVRQMSQAAKILSKTKSQMNKSKKIVTRSSAEARTKKNISNKKSLVNKNTTKKAATKTTPSAGPEPSNEECKNEVETGIKIENVRDQEHLSNEDINQHADASDKRSSLAEIAVPSVNNTNKQCAIKENAITDSVSTSAFVEQNTCMKTSQNNNQQDSSKSEHTIVEVASSKISWNTSNIGLTTCESDKNVPNNKNIKRSKRISDCIAMLTGKLEQKLKTEQKVSATTPNVKTVANFPTQLPVHVLSAMQKQDNPIQSRPELELPEVPLDVGAGKAGTLKKTPKRKAISRRIIKTDDEEKIDVLAPAIGPPTAISGNVVPVVMKETEVLPPVNDGSIAKANVFQQTLPISAVAKSIVTSEPVLCPMDANKISTVASATLIAPMPPVIPINNQQIISKVPLFLPVENVRPPHLGQMSLPLSLPVPVTVPVPVPVPAPRPLPLESITQRSAVAHSAAVAAAGISLIPPTALPLITAVPPAHLPPPSAITLTATSFSIPVSAEPLNLSSSSKNMLKQSQDLSCSGRQRTSGIPARRQTICGFEARNFVMFDEMEPLDLSKKSRLDKSTPSGLLLPNSIELAPMILPAQSPIPVSQPPIHPSADTSLMAVPPLTPEALLNKPFYSNLDLLRIPQVRNPVVGQVTTTTEQTPPPPPPTVVSVNNTPIASIAPILPVKPSSKKRNKLTTVTTSTVSTSSVESMASTTNNSFNKLNNPKDNASSKKDISAKGKVTLRMDEEVINHIDDAINSVINAVKASLDSEEAEQSQGVCMGNLPKTTDDVNVPKESVGEFKYLTASRRNMRSKTLDCRPAALNKAIVHSPPSLLVYNNPTVAVNHTPNQIITVKSIETLNGFGANNVPPQCSNANEVLIGRPKDILETKKPETTVCYKREEPQNEELPVVAVTGNQSSATPVELGNTYDIDSTIQNIPRKGGTVEHLSTEDATRLNDNVCLPLEKAKDKANIELIVPLADTDGTIVNPTTTNQTNLDVEQMSNNNNTSSGFHSSAQSDQQTSVMSTATSVSASVMISDTKKKQRRRRKNELAAIVADQLLESFKLDKARRDNLKKLENLAYEKSEDLLLTGMLLMSSTKRNVNSTPAANACVTTTLSTTDTNETGHNTTKRAIKTNQVSEIPNVTSLVGQVEGTVVDRPVMESDKTALESGEVIDGKKTNKRRQYRRRGKTLDNENISKLKSSLESFSIDIERQLTEYEAKNVNVFKNVSNNGPAKAQTNAKTQTSVNCKPSIILRPSILSVTLEATANVDNSQTVKISANANDTSKTVVSSRDPRLNKNIHKEGEKVSEVAPDDKKQVVHQKTQQAGLEEIGDLEEDNYLTEIAKNVNEKIMSTENEEFAFKDDGFEMANEMGMDDSNSKFSRPPTSMSVRSAPNFNDDQSNFGSMCDENTNTEVMDMDLDDEMSVYTSYSQDLGRGRGRRRRRRRSILLTRKPKKRASSRDLQAEKIECILCKKVFYSANSLSKHNMTLAHVSKVSEQEYLLSKSLANPIANIECCGTLGPYARRSTRRATISEPPTQLQSCIETSLPPLPMPTAANSALPITTSQSQIPQAQTTIKTFASLEIPSEKREDLTQPPVVEDAPKPLNTLHLPKDVQDTDFEGNNGNGMSAAYNGNSRLNLNPDERLFFECCNILKSAETPRINNVIVTEQSNNLNTNYEGYTFSQQDKLENTGNAICVRDRTNVANANVDNAMARNSSVQVVRHVTANSSTHPNQQLPIEQPTLFRDPQSINTSNCFNKSVGENRAARSPTYSAISHLSAVTNTTSRFKTKAAMKGYENVNVDLIQQQESKSRTICKLTELAEIALGNEDKPNSHSFSPIQSSFTPPRPVLQPTSCTPKIDVVDSAMRIKGLPVPDFTTLLATDTPKEANVQLSGRNDRTKNNETHSSTSSKTIMHSSIIKAAVEEHQKVQSSSKIIIPDRPFKNIGLEEKETITFQKPKTPAVHLLTEDNNSVSTGSFSDRDDYDFGSLSCDEEASVRESNDRNPKNNSSESSSESSRATAKTFENKSLIMGRIFKNVSTKATVKNTVAAIKVKSVGVQKDQTPGPKADLNQLFDELRGNSGADGHGNERTSNIGGTERGTITGTSNRINHKQHQRDVPKHTQQQPKHIVPAASPPAVVSSTTATPSTSSRKNKAKESRAKPKAVGKTRKDISKLQSELGMSPDEIKKLIDEGQRKSKRRCATNRPKKLVEMWSSDEYEEFLSTKDIIALIEEKEREEKRKKRKNSLNISSNNSEMVKEKETSDVTSSTKETKRKNSRKATAVRRDVLQSDQDNIDVKFNKPKKSGVARKEDPVSTTAAAAIVSAKVVSQKNATKVPAVGSSNNAKTKRGTDTNKAKLKKSPKAKAVNSNTTSNRSRRKKSFDNSDDIEDDGYNDSGNDDDEDFLIADLKQRQNNKTRSRKANKSKTAAPIVTSTANVKVPKSLPNPQSSRKRSSNTSSTNATSTNTPSAKEANTNAKAQKQSPQKGKRKNQTNQSPPRRKRPASEKLYYWSSSSDEDFGRINNKKNNAANADNFDNGGEQYQKHGWIVGDSHKKLVTLLAIAKGNKKVDSNSGVKKNVTKKRN